MSPDRSDDPREHGRAGNGRRLRERLRRLRIGPSVPRFYFDVREGARFIPDEEGAEFDSLDIGPNPGAAPPGAGSAASCPMRSGPFKIEQNTGTALLPS